MEQKVFSVMSEEFTKNYNFYKDYDDMVIHKETEQIFKTNFINRFYIFESFGQILDLNNFFHSIPLFISYKFLFKRIITLQIFEAIKVMVRCKNTQLSCNFRCVF